MKKYNDSVTITRNGGSSFFYADALDLQPGRILLGLSHNSTDGASGRLSFVLDAGEARQVADLILRAAQEAEEANRAAS